MLKVDKNTITFDGIVGDILMELVVAYYEFRKKNSVMTPE